MFLQSDLDHLYLSNEKLLLLEDLNKLKFSLKNPKYPNCLY